MYVTPPDTDIYSIPRLLAPMPQKVRENKVREQSLKLESVECAN